MPNFVLKPGGASYLLASHLSLPNGKSVQSASGKNKTTGRLRVEPGVILSVPSKHYFGGAQDRWKETTGAPHYVVNPELQRILENEERPSETEVSLPPATFPSKPFMFPTEDGLYDVYRGAGDKVNDAPLELDAAQVLLTSLLKEKEKEAAAPVRRTAPKGTKTTKK